MLMKFLKFLFPDLLNFECHLFTMPDLIKSEKQENGGAQQDEIAKISPESSVKWRSDCYFDAPNEVVREIVNVGGFNPEKIIARREVGIGDALVIPCRLPCGLEPIHVIEKIVFSP